MTQIEATPIDPLLLGHLPEDCWGYVPDETAEVMAKLVVQAWTSWGREPELADVAQRVAGQVGDKSACKFSRAVWEIDVTANAMRRFGDPTAETTLQNIRSLGIFLRENRLELPLLRQEQACTTADIGDLSRTLVGMREPMQRAQRGEGDPGLALIANRDISDHQAFVWGVLETASRVMTARLGLTPKIEVPVWRGDIQKDVPLPNLIVAALCEMPIRREGIRDFRSFREVRAMGVYDRLDDFSPEAAAAVDHQLVAAH